MTAWQFWPGVGRGVVSNEYTSFLKTLEKNSEEEKVLAQKAKDLEGVGRQLAQKYGFKFLSVERRYKEGDHPHSLSPIIPPKRLILLGFEIAPAGIARWRVLQKLASGVKLAGQQSKGWNVWLEESELGMLANIFKPSVLPPIEERNLVQSDGTLANFGGHYRVMGTTNNAQFWVICPDGSLREPDSHEGRGYQQQYKGMEGDKRWNVIAPEELAISWRKSSAAAPHEFTVHKLPVSGSLTPAQMEMVGRLQAEIAERFKNTHGLASGKVSPGIGQGWGLVEVSASTEAEKEPPAPTVAEGGTPASPEQIQSLLNKFNK